MSAGDLETLRRLARVTTEAPAARDRLIRRLAAQGVARRELADAAGISRMRVSQVIRGTR